MICKPSAALVLLAGASMLAACGSELANPLGGVGVTGYETSSAFSPVGHSVAALGENRVRVTATGSATTPKARVEKIALARAAEYGAESGHRYFRTDPPQFTVKCGKRERMERGEKIKIPARGYSVVDIDVTYSKAPDDPTFRPTKDVAEALKAEIAAEAAVPDEASRAAIDAQCGA